MSQNLLGFWYMALSTPYGVEISVSDFEYVRQRLYSVRREVQDEDLERIAICQSAFDPDRLWLTRKPEKPDAQT